MGYKVLEKAAKFKRNKKKKKMWVRVVSTMAGVVVFCTTYALILPAITMERDTVCGIEDHEHTEDCYEVIKTDAPSKGMTVLSCAAESLVHTHTDECMDAEGNILCGLADYVVHEHNELCYDATGNLVCTFEEILVHAHGEDCYEVVIPTPTEQAVQEVVHTHSDECYQMERGELTCTTPEAESHVHEGDCYTDTKVLTCQSEEYEEHTHGDACYEATDTLICQLEEYESHVHETTCYEETKTMTCELPEDENHTHDDTCYESTSVLICELKEGEGHSHDENCHEQTNTLICGLEEGEGHSHGEACYENQASLTCLLEETEGHAHVDSCYEAIPTLICGLEENTEEPQNVDGEGTDSEDSTEDAESGQEEAEVSETKLICTENEVVLHTHEDACYDENGVLSCGYLQVVEHVHSDECFLSTEGTFTYSDETMEAVVEVVSDTLLPKDAQVVITTIENTSEEYAAFSDYAEENMEDCLTGLTAYKVTFISGDVELELENAQITLQITMKDAESEQADQGAVMLMAASEEDTTEEENEEEILNVTPLQLVDGEVTSGDTVQDNGQTVLTVQLQNSNVFAVANTRVQINVTLEHYAHISQLVELNRADYATEEAWQTAISDRAFWIINTDNPTDATVDGDGNITGNSNLPINDGGTTPSSGIKYFDSEQRQKTNSSVMEWSFKKQTTVTKVYSDKTGTYRKNSTLESLDQLRLNKHYYLAFIITQTAEQEAVASDAGIDIDQEYTQTQWDDLEKVNKETAEDSTDGDMVIKGKYWTQYNIIRVSGEDDNLNAIQTQFSTTGNDYVLQEDGVTSLYYADTVYYLTSNKNDTAENDPEGLERKPIYIENDMKVRLEYGIATNQESFETAFYDYDISSAANAKYEDNDGNDEDTDGYSVDLAKGYIYSASNGIGTIAGLGPERFPNGEIDKEWLAEYFEEDSTYVDDKVLMMTQYENQALGINTPSNYTGSGTKLAFGNSNTQTGLGELYFVDTNDGKSVNVYLNKETGVEQYVVDGTWGYQYKTSFLGCSFELVSGYDYANQELQWRDDIVAPDLFSLHTQNTIGKTVYTDGSNLTFKRVGDSYRLVSATVVCEENGVKKSETLPNSLEWMEANDSSYARDGNGNSTKVISNMFWPLDKFVGEYNDFMFQDKDSYDKSNVSNSYMQCVNVDKNGTFTIADDLKSLPSSDDGANRNNYFGMKYSIDFELDGNYIGPLEYLFYGDDDVWVFLTNKQTGESKLVCDIGGVHGSVGSYTDLWDVIPKGTAGRGEYALTIFYTERGASGSSCYMEFTLPNAFDEPIIPEEEGYLEITKKVNDTSVGAEDLHYNFCIELPGDENVNYPYKFYEADGTLLYADEPIVGGTNTFYLKAGQKIVITLPIDTTYRVWEVNDAYYQGTWSGGVPETDENGNYVYKAGALVYKGTIDEDQETIAYTCTNELLGDLTLTKQVKDANDQVINDVGVFKFEITVKDGENWINTTHDTVKSDDNEGTEDEQSKVTFTDATPDNEEDKTTKATITLKAGESITIKGLPVGATWTVTEVDSAGYAVSYIVGEVTESTTPTDGTNTNGTLIYGDNNKVTFINKTGYELPNTGGSGTIWYTLGGLFMITTASLMYSKIRRKEDIASF